MLRNLFFQFLEACSEASKTGSVASPRPEVFFLDRVLLCGDSIDEPLAHELGATVKILRRLHVRVLLKGLNT